MITLYLQVTTRCNLSCGHCYLRSLDTRSDLNDDVIFSFIKKINPRKIVLHGGEPGLLGPLRLEEICRNLPQKSEIHLQSNLVYLESKDVNKWLSFLKKWTNFSIGTSMDINRIKYYERWKTIVHALKKQGINITVISVIIPETPPDFLYDLYEFSRISDIRFKIEFEYRNSYTSDVLKQCQFLVDKLFEFIMLKEDKKRNDLFNIFSLKKGTCNNVFTITPDRKLYTCPNFSSIADMQLGVIGEIDGIHTLREILKNDPKYKSINDFYKNNLSRCDRDCWIICRGGCPAMSRDGRDVYCDIKKKLIRRIYALGDF